MGGMGSLPSRGGGGFGVQLGGSRGGGLSFGLGGGSLSIGVAGGHSGGRVSPNIRDVQRTWQMLEPHRDQLRYQNDFERQDSWQSVQPELETIPHNPIPVQPNRITKPAEMAPVPTAPQPQVNDLPVQVISNQFPAANHQNVLVVEGRLITEEEMERADAFFQDRLETLAKNLESKLPATQFDREQLVQLMVTKKVPPKTQIEIVDALDDGDHKRAQQLWMNALPCCWVPFGPTPARDLLVKIRLAIARGSLSSDDVRVLADSMHYDSVRTNKPTEENCCGADDLVYQLEQEVRIHLAITGFDDDRPAQGGQPGRYGKPNRYGKPSRDLIPDHDSSPNDSRKPEQLLASVLSGQENDQYPENPSEGSGSDGQPGQYGKLNASGTPGQLVPLPTGLVNIVYHPQLPNQSVVVINPQTVVVGTGGQGVFHMEPGYVAEALGNRIADRIPLPHDRSQLVRGGILIVNPTQTKVHFRIDGDENVLNPGARKSFATDTAKVISFDQGNGKKTIRYSLKPGTYRFLIEREGWNVLKTKFEVLISNQGNFDPFHYFVQNEEKTVEPEGTNRHTDDYPITIGFDRGNGAEMKQVLFEEKTGTLQVAINPGDNLWDLYDIPANENAMQSVLKKDPAFVPAF